MVHVHCNFLLYTHACTVHVDTCIQRSQKSQSTVMNCFQIISSYNACMVSIQFPTTVHVYNHNLSVYNHKYVLSVCIYVLSVLTFPLLLNTDPSLSSSLWPLSCLTLFLYSNGTYSNTCDMVMKNIATNTNLTITKFNFFQYTMKNYFITDSKTLHTVIH